MMGPIVKTGWGDSKICPALKDTGTSVRQSAMGSPAPARSLTVIERLSPPNQIQALIEALHAVPP
jgi:hypothetical protein